MPNDERNEQKEEHCESKTKLSVKKNEYTGGNNILRIYSEYLWKLRMNQSWELLVIK